MQTDDLVCPDCGRLDECEHDDLGEGGERVTTSKPGRIEMIALRAIVGGGEVFNTYGGGLPNADLLRRSGFALDANPHDVVRWTTSRDVAASVAGRRWTVEDEQHWRTLVRTTASHMTPSSFVVAAVGHELFVDADAALSAPLWLLCALLADQEATEDGLLALADALAAVDDLDDDELGDLHSASISRKALGQLAQTVVSVLSARLRALHRPDLATAELLELQEVRRGRFSRLTIQRASSRDAELALGHAVDTRLCLETCRSRWLDLSKLA